jgi:hypothetical protein
MLLLIKASERVSFDDGIEEEEEEEEEKKKEKLLTIS